MFAIITPALITGAFAERMKFSAMMLFMVLWSVIVYAPMAHMVWGKGGMLNASLGGPSRLSILPGNGRAYHLRRVGAGLCPVSRQADRLSAGAYASAQRGAQPDWGVKSIKSK